MNAGSTNGNDGTQSSNRALAAILLRALRNTAVSVLYQDVDLRIVWAENVPPTFAAEDVVGKLDSDLLPAGEAAAVLERKRAVLAGGPQERLEICLPPRAGLHDELWFDLWIEADTDADGRTVRGVVTTVVETTEQKRRERTLRVLLREVSHRSRNLLAIIQSIATQTGRYSSTVDGFLSRFRGRLQSFASSQDLVTSSNWRGADLRELALSQIARYSATPHASLRLEGERPYLNPNAALHIGLALHELIANSVSHGALSSAKGYATLSAALESDASGEKSLLLVWREALATPTPSADEGWERRFGSVALERIVPASLNGSARLSFEDGALTYRLLVPHGNFEKQ